MAKTPPRRRSFYGAVKEIGTQIGEVHAVVLAKVSQPLVFIPNDLNWE
jgi:hypothetical protein